MRLRFLLLLGGSLTLLTALGAFLTFRMDNIPVAMFCLVMSVMCFILGAKDDQN
jgi:hypothetical protein